MLRRPPVTPEAAPRRLPSRPPDYLLEARTPPPASVGRALTLRCRPAPPREELSALSAATPRPARTDTPPAILHQILAAVSHMHQRDIVHRDIKPENILFETKDKDSPVKLIDFGFARKHFGNQGEPPMTTTAGTPYYIAPEVLARKYDKSCDLWSVGVVAYVLMCGYPAFNSADDDEVHDAVRRGWYRFPSEEWSGSSREARDFIRHLLQF
ncbi:hypothetical protein ACHAWF_000131, partial [Thalassiosira exigua]